MRGHRPGYILAATMWVLCAFLAAADAGASSLRLVSGGRIIPEEYAPVLVEGGFVVPAGLAELFGASVRAAGAGVELTYQGRSLSFALEGEPRALQIGRAHV